LDSCPGRLKVGAVNKQKKKGGTGELKNGISIAGKDLLTSQGEEPSKKKGKAEGTIIQTILKMWKVGSAS